MNQYVIGIITYTGIMLIAVLGMSVLTGFTGLFSLGHAGFMAIGAYVSAMLVKFCGMPVIVGLIAGTFVSAVIGALVGYPSLRLKGDYFLILTLGFGESVKLILENTQYLTGGAKGLPDIGGNMPVYVVLVIDVLVLIILANFIRSKHGRNCIAVREEETAAETMGINVTNYKMLAMVISCGLCGLSGAMLAHYMGYLQPVMFGSVRSNELIMTVIMGGMGSLTGSTIAAIVLTPLPEILRIGSAQEWRMVIYGLVIVLIIIFKPSGLLGYKELTPSGIRSAFNKACSFCKKRRQRK